MYHSWHPNRRSGRNFGLTGGNFPVALTLKDDFRIRSGCSAARLACLLRKQEVGSSNLPTPTIYKTFLNIRLALWVSLFFICSSFLWGPLGPSRVYAETQTTYKVVSGDNLSFIAKRFGISLKNLRKTNHLSSDVLSIGQILHIDEPFQKRSSAKIKWRNPCSKSGKVLRPFGKYKEKNIIMSRTGVELACPIGSIVKAPATAVVRYIGPLNGFGIVMILEHFNNYTTVYAPLDLKSIKVVEGSAVNAGQILGRTAEPVLENSPPYIHIELRKNKIATKPSVLHP